MLFRSFNPDNVIYKTLFSKVSEVIDCSSFPMIGSEKNPTFANGDIVIFPIYMMGHVRFGLKNYSGFRLNPGQNILPNYKMIFNGDPCVFANIDCMQLIMKRKLWLGYNGWYDKRSFSDGIMYERFVHEHGARYCGEVLGEHW